LDSERRFRPRVKRIRSGTRCPRPGTVRQQSLQAIPQQLNQLQQLAYIQQQQLQQVLQIVPAQLQQLQQVIQIVPQQLQQLLQLLAQQQFGSSHQGMGALTQPQGFASPFQAFSPYTAPFAGSGQVM